MLLWQNLLYEQMYVYEGMIVSFHSDHPLSFNTIDKKVFYLFVHDRTTELFNTYLHITHTHTYIHAYHKEFEGFWSIHVPCRRQQWWWTYNGHVIFSISGIWFSKKGYWFSDFCLLLPLFSSVWGCDDFVALFVCFSQPNEYNGFWS